MNRYQTLVLMTLLMLSACSTTKRPPHHAPVHEGWSQPYTALGIHVVTPDETLKKIAWRYGKTEQELIQWNNLIPPYAVKPGEKLFIKMPTGLPKRSAITPPVTLSPSPVPIAKTAIVTSATQSVVKEKIPSAISPVSAKKVAITPSEDNAIQFQWPLHGTIVGDFGASGGKGIDIATTAGTPVRATAPGKVVYAGDHLRGYGQLVIIRHNANLLSAYGHNQKLLVQEGETVSAGQTIAEAGNTDAKRVMLHFEIRAKGKPVDPMRYLAAMH